MAAAEMWEAVKAAITAYTGLSPAAFFTAVAVAAALYHVVSGLLSPALKPRPARQAPDAEPKEEFGPLPPPVQLGEVTEEELRAYDGSDPKKPLLMAIKGQIYDVTQSRNFYGPGGPYASFAGKDASRALAKMSFEPKDLTGDVSDLGFFEIEALQEWEYKFMSKYIKVGTIKKTIPVTNGDAANPLEASERAADINTPDSHANDAAEPKEDGTTNHENAVQKPEEIREAGLGANAAETDVKNAES